MNRVPSKPAEPDRERAERTLTRLRAQVDDAQQNLAGLEGAILEAEDRLAVSDSQLQEANEQLVLSNLKSQAAADDCAQDLEHMARHAELDQLTGLANRDLLLDRFTQSIAVARRNQSGLALLYVDLNQFKAINDTLGHAAGDAVLAQAAQCLAGVVREVDTVSRQGGDEFLVLLTDITEPMQAEQVAEKVLSALALPSQVGEHVLRLSASIGISLFPDDGESPALLIERADAAMYRSRRRGPGHYAFHDAQALATDVHGPLAVATWARPLTRYEDAVNRQEIANGNLRDANGALVRAALDAMQLQAAAEAANQRQKEFLALVAHELRNPLAPLRVATSLLRGADDESQLEMHGIIERQVMQMSRLIGDLVDLSRGNTGKLRIEPREVDLAGIVDDAVLAARPSMDTRLQKFRVQMPDRPLRLTVDPVRMVQVLSNLLDNASKYTPKGGEIRLAITREQDEVVIRVHDNGIGLLPESLSSVFEPFAQEPHATGFSGSGLGIGLTVVRELVLMHGGTVSAHSEGAGLGSEFVVTFPIAGPAVGAVEPD